MIKRYRKRVFEIEAMQLDVTAANRDAVAAWCSGQLAHDGGMYVPTNHGQAYAATGDYVIKGVNGEFYPCKANVFAELYEQAE